MNCTLKAAYREPEYSLAILFIDTCSLATHHTIRTGVISNVTDLDDTKFLAAVGFVLDEASNRVNSRYRLVNTKFIEATQQVIKLF